MEIGNRKTNTKYLIVSNLRSDLALLDALSSQMELSLLFLFLVDITRIPRFWRGCLLRCSEDNIKREDNVCTGNR